MFVQLMSSEPLNLFWSNMVWWCTIMSRGAMQKDCCANFKVKVTVRACIIKILLFFLYLLNCSSFCNQTFVDGLSSCHPKLEHLVRKCSNCFKIKVTAKVQNFCGCLSGWYLLNHWTFFDQTWYGAASSWARVPSGKMGVLNQGHSEGSYN